MQLSLVPSQRVKDQVRRWLLETLEIPEFNNPRTFPLTFNAYQSDQIFSISPGYWSTDGISYVSVGKDGGGSGMSALDKLSVLICAASHARVVNDQEIADAITRAFGREIMRGFNSLFQGLIYSNEPILRLAIAPSGQIAAEFGEGENAGWFGPAGNPVEVDETWNIVTDTQHNPAVAQPAEEA